MVYLMISEKGPELEVHWCRLSAQDKAVLLPQRGPLIIGAADDADVDVILDAPTVSGRHARLELVPTGKGRRQSDFRSVPLSYVVTAVGERAINQPLDRLLGPSTKVVVLLAGASSRIWDPQMECG